MSMQQKQQESLEHIYISLKGILTILKDLREERKTLINEINAELKPILQDPSKPNIINIETLVKAIEATPTVSNRKLMKSTKELIDQVFLIKKGYDDPDHTCDLVRDWIKDYLDCLAIIIVEQDSKIHDYINKLFQLLGAFRKYIEDEDEEPNKKGKKEEKKEKPEKAPLIGAD